MSARQKAILKNCKTIPQANDCSEKAALPSEEFASLVFSKSVMQKMLPPEIFRNLLKASLGHEKIRPEFADTIAVAMKEWAISHGATHYTHWFQPLTGSSAEKHDAFIEWSTFSDKVIEKFTGTQLIQGEPDASSFPSGGLRSTYEARGYTGWDPSSPVFIWKGGDGATLCIPSVFFSWTGDILDCKIPLIRSEKKLNDACMRLLKLTGVQANAIFTTLGLEQEYFVIDRSLKNLRPDLVLTGRTVFGAPSPKGQELQDHYFASVKDRILRFMRDFELRALHLGIPLKTRHNEVAPAQHEVAPVYERTTVAIDHNILMMELMRQTAVEHGLSCLLHEKPFHAINGSGKHSNWSITTDTGINLLDPTETPENNLHFLVLLTAVLHGVHKHSALLRASIGSASNDFRLGGHEAPPAIISIYLGEELQAVVDNIEKNGYHKGEKRETKYNLNLTHLPDLSKHSTDRNRTSPFAFTGNKFEFRAVGSSSNPAFAITVLNASVAESLNEVVDEIEKSLPKKQTHSREELVNAIVPVLQKYLAQAKGICFSGDNYSQEWVELAKSRGLPNLLKSPTAFKALIEKSTALLFNDILRKEELASRYEIFMLNYIQTIEIELRVMLDLFRSHILQASMKTQKDLAKSIDSYKSATDSKKGLPAQVAQLEKLSHSIERALTHSNALDDLRRRANDIADLQLKAEYYAEEVMGAADAFRNEIDFLETIVDDQYWPLPKYRELLFLV